MKFTNLLDEIYKDSAEKWKSCLAISDRGDFWASSVEILVFVGYMLTSSGFPLSNWGIIFYKFL